MVSFKLEDVHKNDSVDLFLTSFASNRTLNEMDLKWQYLVKPEYVNDIYPSELLTLLTKEDVKTMLQFCSEHFHQIKHPVIIQVSEQNIREGSPYIRAGSDISEAFSP